MSENKPSEDSAHDPRMSSWPDVINSVQTPLGMFALIAIIACVIVTALIVRGDNSPVVYVTVLLLFTLVGVVSYIAVRNPHALHGAKQIPASGEVSRLAERNAETGGTCLRTRADLPYLPREAADASEILFCGISGVSIVAPLSHFWETSLYKGCKVRMLLLNPESPAMATWETLGRFPFAAADVQRSLDNLYQIRRQVGTNGIGPNRCEIRLSETYLPCSMIVVDPEKRTGWMIVEYHAYQSALGERPHIILSRDKDPHWFEFYHSQFTKLWNASQEWNVSVVG